MKLFSSIKTAVHAYKCVMQWSFKTDKISFVFLIILNLAMYLIPIINLIIWRIILNMLVDVSSKLNASHEIWVYIVTYLLFEATVSIARSISRSVSTLFNDKAKLIIDKSIMDKAIDLNVAFFDNPDNLDQVKAAQTSGDYVSDNMASYIDIFINIFSFGASVVIFMSYNRIYGILFLLTYIPGAIVSFKNSSKMDRWEISNIPQTREKDYYKQILISRDYAKEIRVYNLGHYFKKRYDDLWTFIRHERERIFKNSSWKSFVASLITYSGIIGIIALSINNIISNNLKIGDFTLYIGLALTTGSSFQNIVITASTYQGVLFPRLILLDEFLKQKHHQTTGMVSVVPRNPTLEFRNVCFTYPNTQERVLNKLSFRIDSHEKVALIGVNGAGKSTIVKLLLRFYEPDSGDILVGNRNIKDYSFEALYKVFGIYFQDIYPYALSFSESVAISDIDRIYDVQEIENSIKLSGANEVFCKLRNGFETQMTRLFDENGIELSGGQWQKIALSRVFFRQCDFIVLDEPTSSLDPEAEDYIFSSFKNLCKERGGILISHRLSSVILVDRIIMIEKGQVVETGSHNDLMKKDGKYAALYRMQAEKYMEAKNEKI